MKCFYCKGILKNSFTTHVVKHKSCILIVKNVPCNECVQCGETFFDNRITLQLDKIVRNIKTSNTEIVIVNYASDSDQVMAI